jgi:hypothetical protein
VLDGGAELAAGIDGDLRDVVGVVVLVLVVADQEQQVGPPLVQLALQAVVRLSRGGSARHYRP